MKIAFIDRDGTMIFESPDTRQIDSLEKLELLPGVIEGLKRLQAEGYSLVMVSNQDGRGTKSFPEESFRKPQEKLLSLLKKEGIIFEKIFICPHFEKDRCKCRKPKTGLVDAFVKQVKMDREKSFVLGDRPTDLQFAENLGIRGFRMETNGPFARIASTQRTTKETDVFVQCNLDGQGVSQIDTGIGFFNHMLEQLSKHSLIDLTVKAKGDIEVDEHHTVEDVALVLGGALSNALGSRKGIGRFGFLVPLDDALAEVAVDLGGRPYLVFNCKFKRAEVGKFPTELVEHFFRSLSDGLKANIHVNMRYGENEHHKIEAIFKATAKALRMACARDSRAAEQLPSTKGLL